MYCEDSSVDVTNCVFADNTADFGGADLASDGNVDWEDLLKLAEHRLVGVE